MQIALNANVVYSLFVDYPGGHGCFVSLVFLSFKLLLQGGCMWVVLHVN